MKGNFEIFHQLKTACIIPPAISLMIHRSQSSETFVVTVLYHPLLDCSTLYYSSCNKIGNLETRARARLAEVSFHHFYRWKYVAWWIQWAYWNVLQVYIFHANFSLMQVTLLRDICSVDTSMSAVNISRRVVTRFKRVRSRQWSVINRIMLMYAKYFWPNHGCFL